MKKIIKQILLTAIIITAFGANQTYGIFGSLYNTLAGSLQWTKSSLSAVFAQSLSVSKKYTVPALLGIGSIATIATMSDYVENNQDLAILLEIERILKKTHENVQLPENFQLSYNKLLSKRRFSHVKKNIEEYVSVLNNIPSDKHESITYALNNLSHLEQLQTLQKTNERLLSDRVRVLNDKRLKEKVSGEEQWLTLAGYLPNYDDILKKYFTPQSNEQEMQKGIAELEREKEACITHINCPMYKNVAIDKEIITYLNAVIQHAKATKEVAIKLKAMPPTITSESITEAKEIDSKRKELDCALSLEINSCKSLQNKYKTRCWQISAAFCGLAAFAAGTIAFIESAYQGK